MYKLGQKTKLDEAASTDITTVPIILPDRNRPEKKKSIRQELN